MIRFINILGTLAVACMLFIGTAPQPASAQVSLGLSVTIGPPPIPYYVQPAPPGPNWIWQPGYWAWDPVDGYYWVPGTWVEAPAVGLYWTPGYWGWTNGVYLWNAGYWGPTIGFYGGINYGYGYYGNGYYGGRWQGNHFYYNSAVTNVNSSYVRNYTYANRSEYHSWNNRVAYNGGAHGINARPTAAQQHAYSERRFGMTAAQTQHASYAKSDPTYRYNTNHGRIASSAAAVSRPFSAQHAPPAYHAAAAHAAPAHAAPAHAAPAHAAPAHAAPAHAAPVEHHAAPAAVHHAAPAPVHHAAPAAVHHAAPAPVHHAAPAPVHHAAPAPVHHAAPAPVHHAAPAPRPPQAFHPQAAAHPAPAHAAPAHAAPAHPAPHPSGHPR